MKLLLDTHTLLWAVIEPERLALKARRLIGDPRNDLFASAASIFEIAAKYSVARRSSPAVDGSRLLGLALEAGYQMIPISPFEAAAVGSVALFHRDPFDRLLLAQAQALGLRLITHDETLAAYDSRTIVF